MELRRRHVIYYAIILSVISIIVVSRSYDKFSRNTSIDINNRHLIDNNLSDDEIAYLLQENIDVNLFLNYIRYDNFSLYNYKYYNYVAQVEPDLSNVQIIEKGNKLVELEFPLNNLYNILKDGSITIDQVIMLASTQSIYFNESKTMYNPTSLLVVLDEKYYVHNFQPNDLTQIDQSITNGKKMFLREEANKNLVAMCEKVTLITSDNCGGLVVKRSYVSYDTAFKKESLNLIPGHNEFQLGNTIVFNDELNFSNNPTSIWIYDNAHNFGFVLRYPSNKELVTGMSYNNTFRYVGIENARLMYEQQLVLEEKNLQ